MKITMISNYINHHQIPFSNALFELVGDEYHFIQTEPMEEERIQMGWGIDATTIPYVNFLYEQEYECKRLIAESDILLVGWMEQEELLVDRLKSDKLTIRISERLYREGQWKAISPRGLLKKYKDHTSHNKDQVYLLCAGAYVASDFSLVHAYPNKRFQFGYFPETKRMGWDTLKQGKYDDGKIHLVWAGRFIPLKHPEFVIRLAKALRQKEENKISSLSSVNSTLQTSEMTGFQCDKFHIHFIGGGEMEEQLKEEIQEANLQDEITMYGFLSPTEVREIMEKCHVHLFTSNQLEGWGAVVNEAMNSGCVEVVNDQVGAAPYLVNHGSNGLLYKKGSYADFEKQVIYLMEHSEEIAVMAEKAYETIVGQWNAEHAAKELIRFYENWKKGVVDPPKSGPFSVASVNNKR
ncbi:MAG: glycosyltransferase family 4 protein [Eubacteriales bacterium]